MSIASHDRQPTPSAHLDIRRALEENSPGIVGPHFEYSLENDLERIREKISRMVAAGEQA